LIKEDIMNGVSLRTADFRTSLNEHLSRIKSGATAKFNRAAEVARFAVRKMSALLASGFALLSRLRPPVRYAAHAEVIACLRQVEEQALIIAHDIESQAKRLQAFVDLAATASRLNRNTRPALVAALEVLDNDRYWTPSKQNRVFLATRQACAMAKLAYSSGQPALATAAYLKAQQFNHLITDTDCRIGLAIALADVAAHLQVNFDQSAWLTVAMELASGIQERRSRLGAVNYVARQMVRSQVPPTDNASADRRFAAASQAPKRTSKTVSIENGTKISGAVSATAAEDELQFNLIG
jgi:hypothetical protein